MNRTRKLALGLGVAAVLMGGGVAVAAPALAQDDPEPPAETECPYECPFDGEGMGGEGMGGDGMMQMHRRGPGHPENGYQHGPGEGPCHQTPDDDTDTDEDSER